MEMRELAATASLAMRMALLLEKNTHPTTVGNKVDLFLMGYLALASPIFAAQCQFAAVY
jgi:hypothetical protein